MHSNGTLPLLLTLDVPLDARCGYSFNEAANVLTTSLSNQMISLRHIKTWRYDVVFVYENYFIYFTISSR